MVHRAERDRIIGTKALTKPFGMIVRTTFEY
jgi:hypothetical protein